MPLLEPEGLAYLDFQHESILFALQRRRTLIADEPGLGKGHPLSTRIATPYGYKPLGSLTLNDRVMGSSGEPIKILAIHERGMLPVYKVVFNDGSSTTCDGEHLWTVYDENLENWVQVDTLQLGARCHSEKLCIPLHSNPIKFYAKEGCDESFSVGVQVAKDGLLPHEDREIDRFRTASVGQRMGFLSGVLRTIGRVRGEDSHFRLLIKHPLVSFETADTLVDIVRSLGGMVKQCRNYRRYRLDIYLPDGIWYPLVGYNKPRKRINRRWKNFQPGVPPRYVVDVIPHGRDMVRCLSVDAPDNLYTVEQSILTHNTVSAIGTSNNISNVRSMLVICLASHKIHWQRAIEKWDMHGLSVGIAEGDFFPETECVVINYDIIHRHYDAIRAGTWDIMICDEAHYLANEHSRRSLNVFGGTAVKYEWVEDPKTGKPKRQKSERNFYKPILAEREFYLTGTPVPNRIKNLWALVKRIDPRGLGKNLETFQNRYCGAYVDAFGKVVDTGSSNLEELNTLLNERCMIRHLKSEVLKDLPPKVRQVIPLDSAGLQKKLAAEKSAVAELLRAYEEHVGSHIDLDAESLADLVLRASPRMFEDYAASVDDDIGRGTPLDKLAKARAELALEKVPMIVEYVSNLMEQGEKVIVFAYHRAVIEALRDRWHNSCALIYGGTPSHRRQAEADRFQDDPDCNPFIGQYTAAGTGYTLIAATHVVCAELTWLPHEMTQAEDRAHRIGQTDTVNVHHLVVVGSMDDGMLAKIVGKQEVIDQALNPSRNA